MGNINAELGRASNTPNTSLAGGVTPVISSLFGLADTTINKVAPHRISEFYGYTRKYVSFSSLYSLGYTGSASGTVTITGAANFSAAAQQFSTGTISTAITVGGISRNASRSGAGTNYSTTFQLGTGTYTYSLSVTLSSGSGSGFINVIMV
jgi:hypothetical protein